MNMNKRIKADYSFVESGLSQGQSIAVLAPRAIIDYSSIQDNIVVYEYSTTNWLLDTYRTTYVEFLFDKNTKQLYLYSNHPAINHDQIVGFDREWGNAIRLTTNGDFSESTINPLQINELSTISFHDTPKLQFNANDKNELESVEFMQNGYSSDFTYTIPKGAKHYVVNELPTTDIDTTGNYYVMTESIDGRDFSPTTDITNLEPNEYPPIILGILRQGAIVNSGNWVKLDTRKASDGDYYGDIAIKFKITCNVTVSINPKQPYETSMGIDVNGKNVQGASTGQTKKYTRLFTPGEILCVWGKGPSTNQLYYQLKIQSHIVDGKIPLSTKVDEYINFENLWFKNGGSSGSGGKKYFHCIRYYTDDNNQAYINIKNNSSEPFTIVSLCTFLENLGCTYFTKLFVCSGMAQFNGVTETIIGCYRQGVNALRVKTANNNETNFVYIEDTVTEV